MDIMSYVRPELLVVAVVLYFLGMWLKQAAFIKDKYIGTGNCWDFCMWNLRGIGSSICDRTGYFICNLCGNHTRNTGRRIEQLCESNY